MSELRQEYLFRLAHLCHVDVTKPIKLSDFFNLIAGIDDYLEGKRKAANGDG